MRNIVYLGHDNEIVLRFSFAGDFAENGLGNFDEIRMTVGGEVYSTLTNPANLFTDGNDLIATIGDTTALSAGYHHFKVVGFSGVYDDGFILTASECTGIARVQVANC